MLSTLLMLVCSAVQAVDMDLIRVPVADYSAEARQQASRIAMRAMVLRVTGSPEVLVDGAVRSLIDQTDRYLSSYAYAEVDTQVFLDFRFASQAIHNALVEARLPIWGNNRPAVILWLVVSGESGRELANVDHPLAQYASAVAKRRGVELVLPLGDLQDQMMVDAQTILQQDVESLRTASQRYAVSHNIGLVLSSRQSMWSGRGLLIESKQQSALRQTGAAAEVVVELLVETAINQIAADKIYVPSDTTLVHRLIVEGQSTLAQTRTLMNVLQELEFVESFVIRSLEPEKLTVDVTTHTREQPLISAISRLSELQEDANRLLHYQWTDRLESGNGLQ